jgi:hypothetical protein
MFNFWTWKGAKMGYYLAIKVTPEEYKHFPVVEEVYVYVRQLEECIRNPQTSRLLELYPERLKRRKNGSTKV